MAEADLNAMRRWLALLGVGAVLGCVVGVSMIAGGQTTTGVTYIFIILAVLALVTLLYLHKRKQEVQA